MRSDPIFRWRAAQFTSASASFALMLSSEDPSCWTASGTQRFGQISGTPRVAQPFASSSHSDALPARASHVVVRQ